ncbi:hypothetical protein AMTRI_Chr13g119300 [Amborella trichopoda]
MKVNNVGTYIAKPTVAYTAEELSFVMETNFGSAYHMCQLSHPLLKASEVGNIVFISSVAGVVGVAVACGTPYAATKGAMNQITKNLACEWAKDNIQINSVSPWFIRTLAKDLIPNKILESVVARSPMRRIGEPEEVASLVACQLHHISQAKSFVLMVE